MEAAAPKNCRSFAHQERPRTSPDAWFGHRSGWQPENGFTRQSIHLVRVARSDIAGDLGAFFHIAADDDIGRRRAAAISLLKTAIAAIEARDHLLAALSVRRFGVDQRLRLAAPFLAFAAVAWPAP